MQSTLNNSPEIFPRLSRSFRYHSAYDNYFLQAQRVRNLVKVDFDRAFRHRNVLHSPLSSSNTSDQAVDLIVHPSAIGTAPRLDETSSLLDSYLQDVLTVPASLAGIPSLSIPMGTKRPSMKEDGGDDWPVGMSLSGQWGSDAFILRVGEIVEREFAQTK